MNNNSYLCRFIAAHPQDFAELLLRDHCIKVKCEGDLAIFNYTFNCRYEEPLVQESRGIIINYKTMEVVCWPFRKFGNHNEPYADSIDWASARVLEKVDGSIIKLWYDAAEQAWQFSTNGVIRAERADIEGVVGFNYGTVIRRAENYGDIPFDRLDKDSTYIFELVSPETRVLIKYDRTALYHIGTRHNLTGKEREEDIGIQKPRSFPLQSLQDCLNAAAALNPPCAVSEDVEQEGFVVVDKDWHRVKIKSPDYIMMHRMRQVSTLSKHDCVDLLLHDPQHLADLCRENPPLVPLSKFYDYHLAELQLVADKMALLARNLYREYDKDRRAVAGIISRHRLSHVGFRALECSATGREILMDTAFDRLLRLLPDYTPEDLRSLFIAPKE